jgi:hypothetical protein
VQRGWTTWLSVTHIRSGTSLRVCRSRPSTPELQNRRTLTRRVPAASHSLRCSATDRVQELNRRLSASGDGLT